MVKAQVKTQKQKIDVSKIMRLNVYSTDIEGIVVVADVQSKSRPGLTHYTRITIDPLTKRIRKSTCSCEGYCFRGKCWHLQTLKEIASLMGLIQE